MATLSFPDIVHNMIDNNGWYVDDGGERDCMQAYLIYEYHNVCWGKMNWCVCYGPPDDIALRTSGCVGQIRLLWQKGVGQIAEIGSLRKELEDAGVVFSG